MAAGLLKLQIPCEVKKNKKE
jgi:hypothetical protein